MESTPVIQKRDSTAWSSPKKKLRTNSIEVFLRRRILFFCNLKRRREVYKGKGRRNDFEIANIVQRKVNNVMESTERLRKREIHVSTSNSRPSHSLISVGYTFACYLINRYLIPKIQIACVVVGTSGWQPAGNESLHEGYRA